MANKLSQRAIENNWDALNSFFENAEINLDNGSLKMFKARCIYQNHTHGGETKCRKSRMTYGTDQYGGMSLVVPALQDKPNCFSTFSVDYCNFSYINGKLVVSGQDSFNTGKGAYTLTIEQ